jgi:hypothetical protein
MGNKRNTTISEYYQGDESSIGDILTNTTINEEKQMDTEEIEKMIEEFSLNESESEGSKYSSESDLSVEQPEELLNSYYNPDEYKYYPKMGNTSEEDDIDYVKKMEELADEDLFSETDDKEELEDDDLNSETETEEYDSEKAEKETELWESFIKRYTSKKKKEKDELSESSIETIPIQENSLMSISPIEERIEKQLKKLKLDKISISIPSRGKKKFKGTPYERKNKK